MEDCSMQKIADCAYFRRRSDESQCKSQRLKSIFPDSLWNKRTRQFRGPVVILIDQMVISHLKTPLRNG